MHPTVQKILFHAWLVASVIIGIGVGIIVDRSPTVPVDSVTAGFVACCLCLVLPVVIFFMLRKEQ